MSDRCLCWLQDQNGALEMELNDLKSQLDRDILETRQLQEKMIDQGRIEVSSQACNGHRPIILCIALL